MKYYLRLRFGSVSKLNLSPHDKVKTVKFFFFFLLQVQALKNSGMLAFFFLFYPYIFKETSPFIFDQLYHKFL